MERRLMLHEILCKILGTRNVYFQPPPTIQLEYPCIIYERNQIKSNYADNKSYSNVTAYSVTVIDQDPDSLILNKIQKLSMCRFSTHFTADNLNHDVFNIYY